MSLRTFTTAGALFAAAFLMQITGATAAIGAAYYSTPDEAVDALIAAASADDPEAVRAVLGPDVEQLRSGDPVADALERQDFAKAAVASASIEEYGDDYAVLSIGKEDWPFPIPLVKEPQGWRFDTLAGADELLSRRIGDNELTSIEVLRQLVEAEHEYQTIDRDGDGVRTYADRLLSSEGKHDGLYWSAAGDAPESPIGPLVAEATTEGYSVGKGDGPHPYHGYLYRLLEAQGASAPGGEKSYQDEKGRLVAGFAILAYPAEYGASGIMSFQINQSGMLFEKDLGEETKSTAQEIARFDPDKSWTPVLD